MVPSRMSRRGLTRGTRWYGAKSAVNAMLLPVQPRRRMAVSMRGRYRPLVGLGDHTFAVEERVSLDTLNELGGLRFRLELDVRAARHHFAIITDGTSKQPQVRSDSHTHGSRRLGWCTYASVAATKYKKRAWLLNFSHRVGSVSRSFSSVRPTGSRRNTTLVRAFGIPTSASCGQTQLLARVSKVGFLMIG